MSEDLAPNQRASRLWPTLRRLAREFGPERTPFALTVVAIVTSTVLTIIAPWVLGKATDAVFAGFMSLQMRGGQTKDQAIAELEAQGQGDRAAMLRAMDVVPGAGMDFALIGRLLLVTLAVYVAAQALMWAAGWIGNRLIQRVLLRLRERVEDRIHRVPLSYLDGKQRGDILSRLSNDLDNLSQVLNQSLQQIINSVVMVVGVLAMMFALSWQLALVALATLPLTVLVVALIGRRSQREYAEQWKATGELNAYVEESIGGQQLIQVYGATERTLEGFGAVNERVYRSSLRAQALAGSMMPAMSFVSNLVFVGIAVLGAWRVATGGMTLGSVQAFIQYARQFSQPLSQLGGMAAQLQSAAASAERVFDLLDAPDEAGETGTHPDFAPGAGRIEFADVSFAYAPGTPLIEHLSLVAEPGSTIAIVGSTGAGKTTLVNLLLRFYDVDDGSITFDGIDIRELSRTQLRSPIGMVLQDAWLFEGTIYDNIAYGRAGATREEVLAAARDAYVDRFVHHLPDGYDTVITEAADNISQGERQLITIARAFVSQPRVLVLDEATSSVDTRTEVLVQEAMNRLRAGRTSFVIAHRLSTIRNADLIVVMESGHIVEQGSHDELLDADGRYAQLYESQYAQPAEGADADADSAGPGASPGAGLDTAPGAAPSAGPSAGLGTAGQDSAEAP
ncbi:ATP-binding cassette domain-containing protein [Brevibacterium sp. 5221]|uniref:Fatty acid ABC transporter ATP-binding/permease protein n=1 Tax=Brevibacterium rongguiense TaxID=2695267 RepID=A0A6N9H6H2_9MICO|nr:ABC transporter ATP-binding protein [Brevibacterium rongguiense]MYM19162.1 ATP-binding cassette domain-containing protein [Brevibacterium rongguiense]